MGHMFFNELTDANRKRQERDMFLSTLADAISALVVLRREAEMDADIGELVSSMTNVVEDARAECFAIGVAYEDLPFGAKNGIDHPRRRPNDWHSSMIGRQANQVVLNVSRMPVGLMSVGSRKAPRVARAF